MAEGLSPLDEGMTEEEYERLVLLADQRRRGEPCDELEAWLRADPAAAETVEALDRAAEELARQISASAPTAAHVAAQKASLLAKIERRQRIRRLRWVGGLAAAASLVLAAALCWRPAVVGRATVRALSDASQGREYDVRAGQTVTADAGTKIQIDLGGDQEIELQPKASVSVYDHRLTVLSGRVNGSSGSAEMRIDFMDWSILLEPGTRFRVWLTDQRCTLWTDREARLLRGSDERTLTAGETTTLDLSEQNGR